MVSDHSPFPMGLPPAGALQAGPDRHVGARGLADWRPQLPHWWAPYASCLWGRCKQLSRPMSCPAALGSLSSAFCCSALWQTWQLFFLLSLDSSYIQTQTIIKWATLPAGPKLYEANWLDLTRGGHIANVQCAEVRRLSACSDSSPAATTACKDCHVATKSGWQGQQCDQKCNQIIRSLAGCRCGAP